MSTQTAVEDMTVNVVTDVPWRCSWGECSRVAIATVTFEGQGGHVHHCGGHLLVAWERCAVTGVTSITKKACPLDHTTGWPDIPTARV